MGSLTIKGRDALIRWGYHTAAALAAYEMTGTGATATVTAQVVTADDFKLSQQGLTFRIPRQNGPHWDYAVQSLQIAGGTVTATVSLQE